MARVGMKEDGRRTTLVRLFFVEDTENEIGSLLEDSAWQAMLSGIAIEPKWRWTCHAQDPNSPCTVVLIIGWKDGEPSESFLGASSAASALPALTPTMPNALSCIVPLVFMAPQILNVEFENPILTHFYLGTRPQSRGIAELMVLRLPPGLDCSDISESIDEYIQHHFGNIVNSTPNYSVLGGCFRGWAAEKTVQGDRFHVLLWQWPHREEQLRLKDPKDVLEKKYHGDWYHREVQLPLQDLQAKGMSLESSYLQIRLSRRPDLDLPEGAPWYTKYDDL